MWAHPEKKSESRKVGKDQGKAWLDRVKSNGRWGLPCLVLGIFTVMLGFHTADMIVFMSLNVVKQPSIHWELVMLGAVLIVPSYLLLARADKLERRIERGEITSTKETS